MSIDRARAIGSSLPVTVWQWTSSDVILYHLGLGIGYSPSPHRDDLEYLYEERETVLPAFAVLPVAPNVLRLNEFPGIDVGIPDILHGEHELRIFRPITRSGTLLVTATIIDISDKGSSALITISLTCRDQAGALIASNEAAIIVRGEGGLGGNVRPVAQPAAVSIPAHDPDFQISSPTLPHQSAIYRLTGDLNPLHIDPDRAASSSFPAPIMHGLCTYGIALKAVVDGALQGDTASVGLVRARFSGPMYPGETLRTAAWFVDGGVVFECFVDERREKVLSAGLVRLQ